MRERLLTLIVALSLGSLAVGGEIRRPTTWTVSGTVTNVADAADTNDTATYSSIDGSSGGASVDYKGFGSRSTSYARLQLHVISSCDQTNGDSCGVQVSMDNGASWMPLYSAIAMGGGPNAPIDSSIDLDPNVDPSSVVVRVNANYHDDPGCTDPECWPYIPPSWYWGVAQVYGIYTDGTLGTPVSYTVRGSISGFDPNGNNSLCRYPGTLKPSSSYLPYAYDNDPNSASYVYGTGGGNSSYAGTASWVGGFNKPEALGYMRLVMTLSCTASRQYWSLCDYGFTLDRGSTWYWAWETGDGGTGTFSIILPPNVDLSNFYIGVCAKAQYSGWSYAYLSDARIESYSQNGIPPNAAPSGWIDTPNPNGSTAFTRYQPVTLAGWASDDQGQVPTIQARIDGGAWQNVTRRTLRTDITSSYNAGWEWDWNVGTTSTGTHNVQVQACDSLGACTMLNPGTANFTVNSEPVPSAPTSYSATAAGDGLSISLSWANPSSSYYFAYSYVRACDRTASPTCAPTDVWSGSPTTSYTYVTSACRTYAFQIGAVNQDYVGSWTSVFTQATCAPPGISSISPTSGPVGTPVTIVGTNFGASQGSSTVTFNGTTATPTSWSNTQIVTPVPSGATSGSISVTTAGGQASTGTFTVIPAPTISGISPTSGLVGTSVTISGTNFGATQGSSTVKFNGTTATPTSWSDTQIVAPVPSGATSGSISVTTAGGQATSSMFTVSVPPLTPHIDSLSLTTGPAQMGFVIRGSNFGATQEEASTVTIGSTPMSVVPGTWTDTSITVQVPTAAPMGSGSVVVIVNRAPSNGVNFTVIAPFACQP